MSSNIHDTWQQLPGKWPLYQCSRCKQAVEIRDGRDPAVVLAAWPHCDNRIAAHADAWSPDQQSRGLGDTVAKITTKLGIKPCGGCKKRQKALNKLVPYKNNTHDSQ